MFSFYYFLIFQRVMTEEKYIPLNSILVYTKKLVDMLLLPFLVENQ